MEKTIAHEQVLPAKKVQDDSGAFSPGQSTQRTTKSTTALIKAATELLTERDPYTITVTDVVDRAGVTRPTFYSHFGDLPTLFQAAALERLSALFASFRIPSEFCGEPVEMRTMLTRLLAGLKEDSGFYLRVLHGPRGHEAQRAIVFFLADHVLGTSRLGPFLVLDGKSVDGANDFLAAGCVWLIGRWLTSDFSGDNSLEATAERITNLLLAAVSNTRNIQ